MARVDVLGDSDNPTLKQSVRGWIRPATAVSTFLEAYSRSGGTHHSALVLGDRLDGMAAFAAFAELECTVL